MVSTLVKAYAIYTTSRPPWGEQPDRWRLGYVTTPKSKPRRYYKILETNMGRLCHTCRRGRVRGGANGGSTRYIRGGILLFPIIL
jgi:hypothetical protein